MAYYSIEPFGEARGDLRNALLCTLVGNIASGKKGRKLKLDDFMLFERRVSRPGAGQRARNIVLRDWFERRAARGDSG